MAQYEVWIEAHGRGWTFGCMVNSAHDAMVCQNYARRSLMTKVRVVARDHPLPASARVHGHGAISPDITIRDKLVLIDFSEADDVCPH